MALEDPISIDILALTGAFTEMTVQAPMDIGRISIQSFQAFGHTMYPHIFFEPTATFNHMFDFNFEELLIDGVQIAGATIDTLFGMGIASVE